MREVLEETGLQIENVKFFAVTNDIFEEGQKHYVLIFMSAHVMGDQEIYNLELLKVEAWDWFDPASLPDNLFLPLKSLLKQGSLKPSAKTYP